MRIHQPTWRFSRTLALVAPLIVGLGATTSRAAVTISAAPTRHITCSANVCSATAADAVLNAGSLQALLASASVSVTSGSTAQDIVVAAPLRWTSGITLTLDAWRSLTINRPVSVTGVGGLTVLTNDGGTSGVFSIGGKGHVTFASVSSPLTINSQAYMLVNSVTALATAATSNPTGLFALAESDDASQDGVFAGSPINSFSGTFDGLGNSITRLHIGFSSGHNNVTGLFGQIDSATIQHVHLIKIDIHEKQSNVGGLVGVSYRSFLYQDSVAGSITATNFSYVGGLVGQNNLSLLSESFADVAISAGSESVAGGLAGANIGSVVSNSYATGSIAGTPASVGGLIGAVDCACCGHCSQVSTSYSTGAVSAQPGGALGGLIGTLSQTVVSNNYWDTTTSGTDNGVGSGNAESITGLTTAQLRSGLPVGFDPAIWTESPIINDGLPYLIDNPPP